MVPLAKVEARLPDANKADANYQSGYLHGQVTVQLLKQCGDDLTRENVMRQASNLKNVALETIIPSIKINTSPTNYSPITSLQLMQFKGGTWRRFGDIIRADVAE
jgi:branched-chain amino acid transport system substrate-binding protein